MQEFTSECSECDFTLFHCPRVRLEPLESQLIRNLASNVVMFLVAPFKTGQLRYGTGDTSN